MEQQSKSTNSNEVNQNDTSKTHQASSSIEPNSGSSRAGFTIGIISLFFWLIPILGIPLSIIGLILSIIGKNAKRGKLAIIFNCIGLVLAIANSILGAILYAKGIY